MAGRGVRDRSADAVQYPTPTALQNIAAAETMAAVSRSLAIITGASRGFGRALAVKCSEIMRPLDLVLVGRSEQDLSLTQQLVLEKQEEATVAVKPYDLSNISNLQSVALDIFETFNFSRYDRVFFFNNAGSHGDIALVQDIHDAESMRAAFDFNITSSCYLTAQFAKTCSEADSQLDAAVVQTSSLCAIQPFESFAVYCAAKAARNMFHQVLAREWEVTNQGQRLRVLNYAPGPMDTEMHRAIREAPTTFPPLATAFKEAVEQGKVVDVEVSAEKCIRLVLDGSFESGSHVDYFDQV